MRQRSTVASALLAVGLFLSAGFADEQPAVSGARPWMGVLLGDAVDGGVQVVAVMPGGPAERARLQRGDLIVQAEGTTVAAQQTLRELLSSRRPGDPFELVVLRNGEPRSLRIQLGERGQSPPAPARPPEVWVPLESAAGVAPGSPPDRPPLPRLLGIEVSEIPAALREHYGGPPDYGVLVLRTSPGMLADQAGIRVGDLVLELDGRRILFRKELEAGLRAWRAEGPLDAVVVRDGAVQTLHLQPTAATREQARERLSAEERERRQAVRRRLESEIEALERRIEELRRQLSELEAQQER